MGRQKIIGVILGSIREGRVNDRVARWVTGQLERLGVALHQCSGGDHFTDVEPRSEASA